MGYDPAQDGEAGTGPDPELAGYIAEELRESVREEHEAAPLIGAPSSPAARGISTNRAHVSQKYNYVTLQEGGTAPLSAK
jgi:hypothetical protein